MLTIGSLFAGIGGLELGLEWAGLGPVRWQVECDDYATRVLERHWPDVARFRDVRECYGARDDADTAWHVRTESETGRTDGQRVGIRGDSRLAPVDLICGGFPCQDVSLAGRRAGLAGARSGLWSEFARLIGEVGPRWVVAENVPGLLSVDNGGGFGTVLGDLASLGYDAWWDCLPAAAVGAPHRRDRVFVVAYRADASGAGAGDRCEPLGGPGRQPARASESTDIRPRHGAAGPEVAHAVCADVADAEPDGRRAGTGRAGPAGQRWAEPIERGRWWAAQPRMGDLADGLPARLGGCWRAEPDVPRVAHGVPNRVDRLRCLGNAVVPQVAYVIGYWIRRAELAAVRAAEGGR